MIRILLSIVWTTGIIFAMSELVPNGMWLQLAILVISCIGFGGLFTYQLLSGKE